MNSPALSGPTLSAGVVLMVDDEPQARKWFERLYGNEFDIWTAPNVDEALQLLETHGQRISVLLTDYRMPGRNGVELLSEVQRYHAHVTRLLVSAYADKSVAVAAVNQGHVDLILDKPLEEDRTRQALRDALDTSRQRRQNQTLLDERASTLRETLGFLAHEVNTPLATVQGYLTALQHHHSVVDAKLLPLIEAAQRRTEFAQSLVSTFVQSARDAAGGAAPTTGLRASELLRAVQQTYPFEGAETQWLHTDLDADFVLPGRRDLLYLVVCTLVKNALQALQGQTHPAPRLTLGLGNESLGVGAPPWPVIRVSDNGPGIAPERLARLGHEPVDSGAEGSGGMGLLLCRRIMNSLGGDMRLRAPRGEGTTVTLYFPHPVQVPGQTTTRDTP